MATTVVIGGSNPHVPQLQHAASATTTPIELVRDPPNLPELMAQSDIAIICAGGTLWELLYMGCAILSYTRGALQAQVIARLGAIGAVHDLGAIETFDLSRLASAIGLLAGRERRGKMSRMGRKMVDGEGVRRVLQRMLDADPA
jgi:spore coat polysaccharide biosynthesis predicted glycosyltransferase SpsG